VRLYAHPVAFEMMGAAMAAMQGWPRTPGCPQPSKGHPIIPTSVTFSPKVFTCAAAASTQGAKRSVMVPHAAKMGTLRAAACPARRSSRSA
jgi:benzoyl-CoA reductase/2-hydroxyglutaryl-CoA dehydratase subunit BcrC/BadD/HgdB